MSNTERRALKLAQTDAAIIAWQRRLFRASTMLQTLTAQRRRLQKPVAAKPVLAKPAHPLDIPAGLKRGPALLEKVLNGDTLAKAQIASDVAERKKAKARGRVARMKARLSGETKKMPLTGKAALAAINNAD